MCAEDAQKIRRRCVMKRVHKWEKMRRDAPEIRRLLFDFVPMKVDRVAAGCRAGGAKSRAGTNSGSRSTTDANSDQIGREHAVGGSVRVVAE